MCMMLEFRVIFRELFPRLPLLKIFYDVSTIRDFAHIA